MIGSHVSIGHGAVDHAATLKDFCLIGMGAVVLDSAHVGPYSLIAAGIAAKVVRPFTKDEQQSLVLSARNYVEYAATYRM